MHSAIYKKTQREEIMQMQIHPYQNFEEGPKWVCDFSIRKPIQFSLYSWHFCRFFEEKLDEFLWNSSLKFEPKWIRLPFEEIFSDWNYLGQVVKTGKNEPFLFSPERNYIQILNNDPCK